MAKPATILPARNWAGVPATKAAAMPAAATVAPRRKTARRPSQSCMWPAATEPNTCMTLYMAFQADCQCAGIMRWPFTSDANIILFIVITRVSQGLGVCVVEDLEPVDG